MSQAQSRPTGPPPAIRILRRSSIMDAELADAAWHREMAKFVIARSEATKQSSGPSDSRLLRFVRNDERAFLTEQAGKAKNAGAREASAGRSMVGERKPVAFGDLRGW